ncbi:MAG: zinc-finger-containing protein [Roseateles asaccharophilus]|uniref:zinc-finger-containing protein n=1 Tax=Roseateles asaccharophilus TaxID=582607 RepID=UPI00391BA939
MVTGAEVYPKHPELADRHIWRCTACDAHVGCHRPGAKLTGAGGQVTISDGTLPMGSLANPELRAARIETHRMLDALWQPPARMNRHDAYAWMARVLEVPREEAHVASLDFDQCVKVMHAIEDLTRAPKEEPPAPDAARWLAQAGIDHQLAPDGHLLVHAGSETIDFWPDTQRWAVRDQLVGEQEGLHALIMYCVQGSRRR